MIISFIIPVYNVAQYVEKCIMSIISQDAALSDYEIIIVNDGSTDDSPRIIAQLKESYPFIKVINQENKGLGAARNRGLMDARGKYIHFLDSDDYLLPDTLNPLINQIGGDFDIIGFNWKEIFAGGKQQDVKRKVPYDETMTGAKYLNNFNLKGGACLFLFSSSLLREHSLEMPEGIYHEDELFIPQAFAFAQRVVFRDLFVYGYLQRPNSITQERNKDFIRKRLKDSVFVTKELLAFKDSNNFSEPVRNGLKRKINFLTVDMIINLILLKMDQDTIRDTMQEFRNLKLYPLPQHSYSLKYSIFRLLFNNEKSIIYASKLKFF
ncbi:glycosyltransferase [Dysgonomonas sp. 520]|uniref:glycosyltransferase family 2 protein n=1 Tax=Dysgonomonas sp. 520 TaxID=2302931 RepID=UPI0013D4BFF4|nr:glycosyltransferase [Dysgonomonas sp. 520]NDW08200.1 glycosyltransferase [Dysgonomonas sp. 520]